MGNRTFKKVFRDLDKLEEMLRLRSEGWSLPMLGERYGVNHTSIWWHVKKYNIRKGSSFKIVDKKVETKKVEKSYRQYIEEMRKKDNVDSFYKQSKEYWSRYG